LFASETEGWYPSITSQDFEYNIHRDRVTGRSRDLYRNDGWASGGLTRILDATVGAHFRFISMPDYRALSYFAKGFDAEWAREYRHALESRWRTFAEDTNNYCDAARQLTFVQMMRLALRHKIVDGENLLTLDWMPERVGYGAAHFATAIRLIDPDRLSNPQDQTDTMYMRGGVEIDADGVPLAYHIRRAHQNDWYGAVEANIWDRIERETAWGRRTVIHDYDRERADQHRGIPLITPVMNRMKMLTKYDQVELQAAVLNAVLGIAVKSPYDPEGLREVATSEDADDPQYWYWNQLRADRERSPLRFAQAQVLPLRPGEDVTQIQANRPGAMHDPFTYYALRNVASGLGTTAEELTLDWSKSNYSSARAGFVIAIKTAKRRRHDFATNTAMPCVVAVAEEAFDNGELPLPNNAPDFVEARAAYTRGQFLGPGQGNIDPVKERQGQVLGMDMGTTTLMHESAENGADYEENLDQRAIEIRMFRERGLPLPKWFGAETAKETMQPQEAQ
jgi:lambda family phage portal protein